MLTAINKNNGERYISWETPIMIRDIYLKDRSSFKCPYCSEELIFIDGKDVIKHFRHKVENMCEHEPETKIHLEMKEFIAKKFNLSNEEIEYTKLLKYGFKPDGFIEEQNIALEVQHSIISKDKFLERTKKYSEYSINVLWIFDKDMIKESIPSMIKKAHEIYYGRIYVYCNEAKAIYPVHLIPIKRWIKPFNEHGGYFKYYKNKKSSKFGNRIDNFKLKKGYNDWKENEYHIASFYDKKFWKKEEEIKVHPPDDSNSDNTCECGEYKSEEYDLCYECNMNQRGYR